MNLYLIHYDHQPYYVEAHNITDAVARWNRHVKVAWGNEYDGTEEPESIALVHEEAVIR